MVDGKTEFVVKKGESRSSTSLARSATVAGSVRCVARGAARCGTVRYGVLHQIANSTGRRVGLGGRAPGGPQIERRRRERQVRIGRMLVREGARETKGRLCRQGDDVWRGATIGGKLTREMAGGNGEGV